MNVLRLALLCLPIIAACSAGNEPAPVPAAIPVRTALPSPFADTTPLRAVGRLEAADETTLAFASAGVVARVSARIGESATRGAVLAELDTTALDAAVEQAWQSEARARRDLQRARALVDRQLVARQTLDDAQTELELRTAEWQRAVNARRYGTVTAPRDCLVLQRLVEPGEVVAAGQPVLRVAGRGGGFRLAVEVADRDAAGLDPGAAADVVVDAFPGHVIAARVRRVGGGASAQSGAITVELDLPPTKLPLRSGLVAKARFLRQDGAGTGALGIPTAALLDVDDAYAQVFVAQDGRAEQRRVAIGMLAGDRVQVLAGLAADERVVVAGTFRLRAGDAITEVPDGREDNAP
jgi:RND family efflux transporter MFP subunit